MSVITPILVIAILGMSVLGGDGKLAGLTIVPQNPQAVETISGRGAGMGINAQLPTSAQTTAKSSISGDLSGGTVQGLRVADCGNPQAPQSTLTASAVPQLHKLAEYEQVCNTAVADGASFFVSTPKNAQEAKDLATWVASVLRDFSHYGIEPVVFMEPTISSGTLDFKQYRAGAYDTALDAYFSSLKSAGISDAMMGTWVPFPEGNIPVWSSVDPSDFAANVTKTVQFQKKYFPGSKAAVLLESKTYPTATSWEGGKFISLLPYVHDIPDGLLDSFGLQGFAWPPTSAADVATLDPAVFLRTDLAIEAARSLGVHEIWFNTGTFGKSVIVSRSQPYVLSPQQRQQVLDSVLAQAKKVQTAGFTTAVHLFAKDKSATEEGIDWSYWQSGKANEGSATGVFKTFAHDLQSNHIPLWIFDSNE